MVNMEQIYNFEEIHEYVKIERMKLYWQFLSKLKRSVKNHYILK